MHAYHTGISVRAILRTLFLFFDDSEPAIRTRPSIIASMPLIPCPSLPKPAPTLAFQGHSLPQLNFMPNLTQSQRMHYPKAKHEDTWNPEMELEILNLEKVKEPVVDERLVRALDEAMYDADDEGDDTSIRAIYSLEEWEKEKNYVWHDLPISESVEFLQWWE